MPTSENGTDMWKLKSSTSSLELGQLKIEKFI
jgi:hypothetical protein